MKLSPRRSRSTRVLVEVEADHVVADLDRAHRERQADVALADHDDGAVVRAQSVVPDSHGESSVPKNCQQK